MSTVHQGLKSGRAQRVNSLLVVPTGNAFTSPEALSLGHAYLRSFKTESVTNDDFQKAYRPYAHNVEVRHETFRATWPMLLNLYLLIKNGLVDAKLQMADGDYWYFINDSTPATPNGSTNLGPAFEYSHTVTMSKLAAMFSGQVNDDELDWMADAVAATTGGAGTGTIGMSAGGYDLTTDVPGNFQSFQFTNAAGAALEGAMLDMNFTLKSSDKYDKDTRNRYTHSMFDWSLKGKSKSVGASNIKAWTTDARAGVAILATLADGRKISLPTVPSKMSITKADDDHIIDFEVKGQTCLNVTETSGATEAIDIGVTNADTLAIKNRGTN
ncbi:MAG: hypothetical protein JSS75_07175 [Bacteroidetes bacterium]|nr:hypothetical protein [Bacteroidota bacterium]